MFLNKLQLLMIICYTELVPYELSISNSFYLNPITPIEIINTLTSLFHSHAIGIDGLRPDIIKTNVDIINFK